MRLIRMSTFGAFTLASLFMVVPAVGADAQDDGNRLLRSCKEALKDTPIPPQSSEQAASLTVGMWCRGFLTGLADMNALYQGNIVGETHGYFCFPKSGLDRDQSIRIVVKYLESTPEDLHKPARWLAAQALGAAFPCVNLKP